MKRSPWPLLLGTLLFAVAGWTAGPPQGDKLAEGQWWLYQLQYDHARTIFDQAIAADPKNPAGYFFKTAVDWWELAQKAEYDLPKIQEQLEKDYQDTIQVARDLYDSTSDPKIKAQACLYWGGAEGLKGRWLVTQRQWVHAYFRGKSGARLLRKTLALDPTLYDANLGLGIYDYFTDTLPGVEGVLSAMLIHGDRKRGLKELHEAIEKGTYSKTEATAFLIEIYTWEEHTPVLALPLAEQLYRDLPQSPFSHLALIMDYYELKRWDDVSREAQIFLERSEKEEPNYTKAGAQPGLYCLGVAALNGQHDAQKCLTYMNQILSGKIDASRWVSFAYLRRGQAYDVLGEREKAVDDYKKALSRANVWGSHQQARNGLNEPFQLSTSSSTL